MDNHQSQTTKPNNYLVIILLLAGLVIGYLIFSTYQPGKTVTNNQQDINNSQNSPGTDEQSNFLGNTGTAVKANNNSININESEVDDGNIHYYNYYSDAQNKIIYFFIIKAPDNTYRAAANACEVCYGSRKGFTQVGDLIRCENCQTTYTKDKIAKEKGGCNPGPIDSNVKVENNQLRLNITDIENVANLF